MKYTAINIGPIISTFGMARKPRELWAASYMFSHLMRCIYNAAENAKCDILSPAKPKTEKNKIGIYPDRIFFKGALPEDLLKNARRVFCETTKISENCFQQYFNIMSATDEAKGDSDAIRKLNQHLDVLELCNYAADYDTVNAVRRLIARTNHSPLFALEGNENTFPFDVNTLAEIATKQLHDKNKEEWERIRSNAREKERAAEKMRKSSIEASQDSDSDNPDYSISINEDVFYKGISQVDEFKAMLKSHHKYFCVVQADGDNVGKTVSHEKLKDGQVLEISTALVDFGIKASGLIEEFGGLPIYAGGDDLLFIAPVLGKDSSNIFDLLSKIEKEAFGKVREKVDEYKLLYKDKDGNDKPVEASLSFGMSISYYKYPLYEAFETARNLLFGTAKAINDKKAVAWSLRKHSGGTFDAAFSLKAGNLQNAFTNLINETKPDTVVSAVAHKIREHEELVKNVVASKKQDRLDSLFNNILEFKDSGYFNSVKELMPILYEAVGENKYISTLYSILRTAKFIKGEDLHDVE